MKTKHISHCNLCAALVGSLLLAQPSAATAQIATFDAKLDSPQFRLYTDPYNGNQIKIGGFSGIYPVLEKSDTFYVITDRGPTTDFVNAGGTTFKTFATPRFGPHILTVRLQPDATTKIDEVTPLKRPDGSHISGLPTSRPATDVPYDFDLNQLPYDEDSLDAEGITIDPWGNFWVCEEYKPSVAMVAANGKVQMRLVPAGTLTGAEQVPTYDVLPGVLAKRRNNRGLEGIAASSDGILYAIMQRPLNNPNRTAADANGNVRILVINLKVLLYGCPEVLVRQYLYRIPTVPNNITLSDLFSTAPGKLLVPERATDKLYEADLTGATDITPFENAAGKLISDPTKTIEQLDAAGLEALGIVPVTKTIILDSLTVIDPLLEKIEGICVVGNMLVLTYDNDFNVAEAASIPTNPNPNGPFVQLELLGANFPRIYVLPLP
ncbi:MAG: esterase-like activity of phytase family protein [Verrucomicrobia subdivision 3 bacterium]|nr:esterase-like activity of phytase family protein [Limisphaerales bacterium]